MFHRLPPDEAPGIPGSGRSRKGLLLPWAPAGQFLTFSSLSIHSIPPRECLSYASEAGDLTLTKPYSFPGSDSMKHHEDPRPLGLESGFSKRYDPVLSWKHINKQLSCRLNSAHDPASLVLEKMPLEPHGPAASFEHLPSWLLCKSPVSSLLSLCLCLSLSSDRMNMGIEAKII